MGASAYSLAPRKGGNRRRPLSRQHHGRPAEAAADLARCGGADGSRGVGAVRQGDDQLWTTDAHWRTRCIGAALRPTLAADRARDRAYQDVRPSEGFSGFRRRC